MRRRRSLVAIFGAAVFALAIGASQARPASVPVTITFVANALNQAAWEVLIPNFERVYPNITVDVTYVASSSYSQVLSTEFAAGNAPDLFAPNISTCGSVTSMCTLAPSGDLVPIVKAPWAKRAPGSMISAEKYGPVLYGVPLAATFEGMFTNDTLFAKLGLKIPQTFSQLRSVCQKAQADGVAAVSLPGENGAVFGFLVFDLAVATVYANDPHWNAQRKAGTVTFAGSAGWRQALQEVVEMSNAGCFEPGAAGTSSTIALFAQGQGLMDPNSASERGNLAALDPQFSYSFHPFPGGATPNQLNTFFFVSALSVNAHASSQEQAAAETFINFMARPAQDALYAEIGGDLTPYELLKGQIPSYLSAMSTLISKHQYIDEPIVGWPSGPSLALAQDEVGLLTGQETVDGVLQAMDAAWAQGPS